MCVFKLKQQPHLSPKERGEYTEKQLQGSPCKFHTEPSSKSQSPFLSRWSMDKLMGLEEAIQIKVNHNF